MKFKPFPDDPKPVGPESWRKVAWSALMRSVKWYFYLGVAVALFTPGALVRGTPVIGSLIELMSAFVPAIPKFMNLSTFPEVTGLYYSLMWLLLPVPVVLSMLRWSPLPRPTVKQTMIILFLVPLFNLAILLVFFVLPIRENFTLSFRSGQGIMYMTLMSEYRLALGVFASLVFAILAGFTGAWLKFIWVTMLRMVGKADRFDRYEGDNE